MDHDDNFKITAEMEMIMAELKRKIQTDFGEKEVDDGKICRFLRARDFNPMQGEKMYREHIEWKEKYKIPKIGEDFIPSEVQNKYYNLCHLGFAKGGHPILYFDFGHCDYKGLLKSVKYWYLLCGLLKTVLLMEKLMSEQTMKLGKPVEKFIAIFDCQDLQISQFLYKPTIDFVMDVFHFYEANFPERLKTGYMINAPPIFNTIFNIIKPFFSATTLEKIKVYGKDGWREELLRVMHEIDLPVFLGGTKTDPDGNPLCMNMLKFSDVIPKHYYFRSPERRLKGKPFVKEYILKSGEKLDIPFCIDEVNSRIECEFETEKGDISFEFLYKTDDKSEDLTSIFDFRRGNTDKQMDGLFYLCEKCGIYILSLDNSYSWVRGKQIFLKAWTIKPNGEISYIV